MKIVLFWMAVTGWAMSLVAHLFSVFDFDLQEKLPYIWLLHIGIFVVWFPTITTMRKATGLRDITRGVRAIAQQRPTWVVVIAGAGFIYAMINFLVFISAEPGSPAIRDGHYYLHSHGQWIRDITEQEYHHYQAINIRGFSGHWIFFYGLAAAVLWPFPKKPASPAAQTALSAS